MARGLLLRRSVGNWVRAVKTQMEEKYVKNLFVRLWKEEEGQDLTEYALLLVLVALAAIGALRPLATAINTVFGAAANNLAVTAPAST